MSLRVKLTIYMLIVSILPMLLYASVAYSMIRTNALNTAVETSAALFQSNMDNYEQKVTRLYGTSLDIVSNTWLRMLFKSVLNNRGGGDLLTRYQRRQILTNTSNVLRTMDAHYAAQRDLLSGIGLIAYERNYTSLSVGSISVSEGALRAAYDAPGSPLLYADIVNGEVTLSICISFSTLTLDDLLGACMLRLKTSGLYETLLPSGVLAEDSLFILDGEQNILFHSDRSQIGRRFENSDLLQPPDGMNLTSYSVNNAGETFVVTCQRTSSNPEWTVYYAVPHDTFISSSQNIAGMILPFAILCALMALAAALVSSWSVYQPIRYLTGAISRMSGRNLMILEPKNNPKEISLLIGSFNRLMEDINALLIKVEAEAENTRKAEIIALRAQISPHFLYNTLNVIKCLAAQNQTEEIQSAVTSLIELLRASIGSARDIVSLKRELVYVENYILLQRLRLDLHFQYKVDIAPGVEDLSIPHLTLQPMVENALIHAFPVITKDDNTIEVRAWLEEGMLTLCVEDNGNGLNEAASSTLNALFTSESPIWTDKVGLHNVYERARHLFGDAVRFRIENTGHGTRVIVQIPAIPYIETDA